MNMQTVLEVEIEEKFNNLASMDPGSTEYTNAVDSLTKLIDKTIEIENSIQLRNKTKLSWLRKESLAWSRIVSTLVRLFCHSS